MPYEFVELNRKFIEYNAEKNREELAYRSYLPMWTDKAKTWMDLLNHGRVVVLGEAGSGKTCEFKAQVHTISTRNEFTFFIRLEDLVTQELAQILSLEESRKLKKWQKSEGEAYFFLDAIDESRLISFNSFEKALKNLSRSLGEAITHAKIVISSRITEWRGQADRDLIALHLPVRNREEIASNNKQPDEFDEEDEQREGPLKTELPVFVVELAPLNDEQIYKFASTYINNSEDFLEAIKESDFGAFVGRPIDVNMLLDYWIAHGKLGSLSELQEFNLVKKLEESNQNRSQSDPLDAKRAREGAEILAAASVLTRILSFVHPENSSSEETQFALNAQIILPDWTKGEIKALFARSLFDGAAYGKVRFHHRRTLEYLAACWFHRLTEANLPLVRLRSLLFRQSHGFYVIPPSLIPVVAWLAGWRPAIRKEVIKVDPGILLRHGDSALIPIPERHILLDHIVSQNRPRINEIYDLAQLRRLAHPSLSAVIIEHLLLPNALASTQLLMLGLILQGKLTDCADAVQQIAINSSIPMDVRCEAIETLAKIGNYTQFSKVIKAYLHDRQTLRLDEIKALCSNYYPSFLDENQLEDLLTKIEPPQKGIFDPIGYTLQIMAEQLSENKIIAFGDVLSRLFEKHVNSIEDVYWLYRPLATIVQRILSLQSYDPLLSEWIGYVIEQLIILSKLEENHYQEPLHLKGLEKRYSVKRYLFWNRVKSKRQKENFDDRSLHYYSLTGWKSPWSLSTDDINWLLHDAENKVLMEDQKVAFQIALQLWNSPKATRDPKLLKRIRKLAKGNTFRDIYRQQCPGLFQRLKLWANIQKDQVKWKYGSHYWQCIYHNLIRFWFRTQVLFSALWNFQTLKNKPSFSLLYRLLHSYREKKPSNRYGQYDLSPIKKHYGTWIYNATREGLKQFWKNDTSSQQQGGVCTNGTIVSLIGINVALQDGLNLATLTDAEAVTASGHALNELNGLPKWLSILALSHPKAIREVLLPRLQNEFNMPESDHYYGLLDKICYGPSEILEIISPDLLEMLKVKNPDNLRVFYLVLNILIKTQTNELLALTSQRTHNAPSSHLSGWLTIWLRLDALPALDFLEAHISSVKPDEAYYLVLRLACSLHNEWKDAKNSNIEVSFRAVPALIRLIPILYRHIRREDDLSHDGVYSPSQRDHAQDFRGSTLYWLMDSSETGAYEALLAIAELPELQASREWILAKAYEKAQNDAECIWEAVDIASFSERYERIPSSPDELFDIVSNRLIDIKDNAEQGDFSWHGMFTKNTNEKAFQKLIADKLETVSKGVYQVARELEVFDDKLPDIRIFRAGVGFVTIEIKIAHKWSYTELVSALTDQLAEQYMRLDESKHGVLILVNLVANRKWHPTPKKKLGFTALLEELGQEAVQLTEKRGCQERIIVVGIDLS